MNIRINGRLQEIGSVRTVAGLLDSLRVPRGSALVEQNGNVIARTDFPITAVNEGDSIEIVQMAAGG
jgi:thiamine biosynthesis protein ThiS